VASSRSSRPTGSAKKNMATESSLYSTIRCIHNGGSFQKITQQFQLLNPRLFFFFFFLGPVCVGSGSTSAFKAYCANPRLFIYSHTESSNTHYMPYSLRVFSRIMDKKCSWLVTHTL
jgi:hypothetical protein